MLALTLPVLYKCQANRRNLTDAEIMRARESLERCGNGRPNKEHNVGHLSKIDEQELFNKSNGTIEKQRFVDDNATDEQKKSVDILKKPIVKYIMTIG